MRNSVNFSLLLVVQFLTAFTDYAALFATMAMVMQKANSPAWYIPALQGLFLTAYVVLAPWVGLFADRHPKSVVLGRANAIKAIGAALLFLEIEPLLGYAIIGIGAAFYAPAKYGILPELVAPERLIAANGSIEGVTIVAMLAGSLGGGAVADRAPGLALGGVTGLFLVAALTALRIKSPPGRKTQSDLAAIRHFGALIKNFLQIVRVRLYVLGVGLFWAATAALRVMLFAWAPLVLAIPDSAGIAALSLTIFLGIAAGAAVVSFLIPLEKLARVRFAAYSLGAMVLLLAITTEIWPARAVLFLVGLSGGMFLVPLNAALQELGHRSIGSGNTIAVQQFFESIAMVSATAIYGIAASFGATPVISIAALGLVIILTTLVISGRISSNRY